MAIDPGNLLSAYVIIDASTYQPLDFAKITNTNLRQKIYTKSPPFSPTPKAPPSGGDQGGIPPFSLLVIERVQSFGMPVGREIFETCEWVGRFTEAATIRGIPVDYITRIEEKQYICHDSRAKDANIRQALIDRFARRDFKNGKGTKQAPDFFYGFHHDIWQAYSVAVSYLDKHKYTQE